MSFLIQARIGRADVSMDVGAGPVLCESTAPYLVTLKKSASSANSIIVVANAIGTNRNIHWTQASSNSFMANGMTATVASSFVFSATFI